MIKWADGKAGEAQQDFELTYEPEPYCSYCRNGRQVIAYAGLIPCPECRPPSPWPRRLLLAALVACAAAGVYFRG